MKPLPNHTEDDIRRLRDGLIADAEACDRMLADIRSGRAFARRDQPLSEQPYDDRSPERFDGQA